MSSSKPISDLETVLVDLPLSEEEKFVSLMTGQKPNLEPVEMTYGDYKLIRTFRRLLMATTILICAGAGYVSAIREHGSISNAYQAIIQSLEQEIDHYPPTMFNP